MKLILLVAALSFLVGCESGSDGGSSLPTEGTNTGNDNGQTTTTIPSIPSQRSFGGSSYDIKVHGSFAFIAKEAAGLEIFNISNASNPTLVSSYRSFGYAYGVKISSDGNTAYLANGDSGMDILNISDKSTPTLIAYFKISGRVKDIEVSSDGNTAFLATHGIGLDIINISDPTTPTHITTYSDSSSPSKVKISSDGNTLYLIDSSGLKILNIADISSPTLIGTYPKGAGNFSLSSDEDTIYLTHNNSGIYIVDISTPSTPSLIKNYDPGSVHDIKISNDGDTGYLVSHYDFSLQTIDITDPTSPSVLDTYTSTVSNFGQSLVISSSENNAYIADQRGGLYILDISNTSSLSLAFNYSSSSDSKAAELTNDKQVMFIADAYSGLQIYDSSSLDVPQLIANYDPLAAVYDLELSSDEDTIYLASTSKGLQIVDVSNLSTPSLVGSFIIAGEAISVKISSDQNTAYIASYNSGLYIIDISTPSSPSQIGFFASTEARKVVLSESSNRIYLGDSTSLKMIDITNPASPILEGEFPVSLTDIEITSDEKFAFISDDSTGVALKVINISDKTSPSLVSTFDFSDVNDHSGSIKLSNDEKSIYITNSRFGVWEVDVEDPLNKLPIALRSYYTKYAGTTSKMYISDDNSTLITSSSNIGTSIIDISIKTEP